MELQTQEVANVLVMHVTGRVDHTTAKQCESLLLPHLEGCTGEVKKALIDLSGVDYMSSAGVRVLMLALRQCQKQQGELVLAELSPMLQEVFKIMRLNSVFRVVATVRDGLAQLSPAAAAMYGRA